MSLPEAPNPTRIRFPRRSTSTTRPWRCSRSTTPSGSGQLSPRTSHPRSVRATTRWIARRPQSGCSNATTSPTRGGWPFIGAMVTTSSSRMNGVMLYPRTVVRSDAPFSATPWSRESWPRLERWSSPPWVTKDGISPWRRGCVAPSSRPRSPARRPAPPASGTSNSSARALATSPRVRSPSSCFQMALPVSFSVKSSSSASPMPATSGTMTMSPSISRATTSSDGAQMVARVTVARRCCRHVASTRSAIR